jgi:hypothetical protein
MYLSKQQLISYKTLFYPLSITFVKAEINKINLDNINLDLDSIMEQLSSIREMLDMNMQLIFLKDLL